VHDRIRATLAAQTPVPRGPPDGRRRLPKRHEPNPHTDPFAPRYTRIAGTGSCLPPRRLTNADMAAELAQRGLETSDDWIVERTGIRARHFADDGVNASDLAVGAARAALEAAGCAGRGHRPDHRGHVDAGHGVPVDRLHPAAQAGHPAARPSTCRRCARASSMR
jgi:hypothetical protein